MATGTAQPAPRDDPVRANLLRRAEAELKQGDAGAALDDFERAAMMRHAADAELGLIRAALQQGLYRRALAFCAHTAGEHLEETDAAALYAWLLRAGGQTRFAERVLADALRRAPTDPLLRQVDASFRNDPLPVARGPLLEPSHRFAPWPVAAPPGKPLPGAGARFIGGAVLIGDGSLAVAPLAAFAALPDTRGRRLWLRNGLGQTAAASLDSAADESLAASGIALLRLDVPLLHTSPVTESMREPFAGSPGYVLRFATTADAAWPWLSQGFLGSSFDDGSAHGRRRLGFDIVGGGNPAGAPVLDAAGRLAGMVVGTAPDGSSVWAPLSAWQRGAAAVLPENAHMPVRASELARDLPRQAIGPSPPGLTASVPTHRALVAPDAIYEAGLPIALQLLVEDR